MKPFFQFLIAIAAAVLITAIGYLLSLALGVAGLAGWFVIVSVFMMLVILIQKPKGGGLSGAFGGAGGSDTSFVGAKVGDVLTLVTVSFFVAFIGLAMLLTWTINPVENRRQGRLSHRTRRPRHHLGPRRSHR